MYDIVIKNASVIDDTASPPFAADLAVEGQKIVEVGRVNQPDAAHVIDAKGHAVAPGFIDMHSHADFSLPILPTADSLVHQGITTVVVGQCGLSPAPLVEESRAEVISAISGFFGDLAKSIPWNEWGSLEDYLHFFSSAGLFTQCNSTDRPGDHSGGGDGFWRRTGKCPPDGPDEGSGHL